MRCETCKEEPEYLYEWPGKRFHPVICPQLRYYRHNPHAVFDKHSTHCHTLLVDNEWRAIRIACAWNRKEHGENAEAAAIPR